MAAPQNKNQLWKYVPRLGQSLFGLNSTLNAVIYKGKDVSVICGYGYAGKVFLPDCKTTGSRDVFPAVLHLVAV